MPVADQLGTVEIRGDLVKACHLCHHYFLLLAQRRWDLISFIFD